MNPTVTVIVPVYNVEDFVSECLDSLLRQTYSDFEVVCVNDGSTDGSRDVLVRYAQLDNRIRVIDRDNGGLSAARNTGLDAALGTYVSFLDSDDKYAPNALEELVCAALENDLELLDFDSDTFYENDQVKGIHQEGMRIRDDIPGVRTGAQLLCEYEERGQYFPSACYHLIRRELLQRCGLRFEEGLLHEDELFTPLLHAHAGASMFLNRKLYLRRLRGDSIMTSKRGVRNILAEHHIVMELTHWMQDHVSDYDERFLHAFGQHIFLLADFMANDAMNCTEEELRAAQKTLPAHERVTFELLAIQNRNGNARLRASYEQSLSYRLAAKLSRFFAR